MSYLAHAGKLLAVVGIFGAGICSAASASAAPSKLMSMLPEGFSSSNCQVETPKGLAIEKVNCDQSTASGGPTAASFALYSSLDDLATGFGGAKFDLHSTCPGNQQSPGPWTSQGQVGGQVECGTISGTDGKVTVVAWSDNAKLRAAAVQGPDIDALYQWWKQKSG